MLPQQYCLRWKYHHSNLQTMFSQLLDRGCFCDVTLACEGQTLKAHRVVLCACSTYFDAILTNCCSEKDPIIIMKDAKFSDVKCLIEFMYKGEINVEHGSLASLLKTAEELKIKGLAEVSWREDENNTETEENSSPQISTSTGSIGETTTTATTTNTTSSLTTSPSLLSPTIPTATTTTSSSALSTTALSTTASATTTTTPPAGLPLLAPLSTIQKESPSPPLLPIKKKRGRPPLDGEFDSYSTPKISHIENAAQFTDSSHLVSVMMDDNSKDQKDGEQMSWAEQNLDTHMDYEDDEPTSNLIPKEERPETPGYCIKQDHDGLSDPGTSSTQPLFLTAQELEEWKDVIKMNDYLTKGRRPQFWEEPFTKRVMDSIKNKDLEMKKAAQILGVSYGTLYGRYRETYGCLKHPYRGPFMVSRLRDMWTEHCLAAELMNTSPTVTGYLDQSQDWNPSIDKDPLDLEEREKLKNKERGEKEKYKERNNKNNNNNNINNNTNNKTITLPNHPEVSLINVKKTFYPIMERCKSESKT